MRHSLLLLLVVLSTTASAQETAPTKTQLLEWLQELEPLPKVHYSWSLDFRATDPELLYEYVRLTRAASLSGEWHNRDEIDLAVQLCRRVNQTNPNLPATLGVNYSPWHRRFGKDLPPTDTSDSHQAELDYLRERMETIRHELGEANARHAADVPVTCIMLDSERFHVRADDPEWNAALTAKYDAVYDIVREVFLRHGSSGMAGGPCSPAPPRPDGLNRICSRWLNREITSAARSIRSPRSATLEKPIAAPSPTPTHMACPK